MDGARVLLLSAYDAISHRLWRTQLMAMFPGINWTVVCGPPRHFAWSLRARPLEWWLDPEVRGQLQARYDAMIVTSTVDLAALFACVPSLAQLPVLLYMHENQFVYPSNQTQAEHLQRAHRLDACMVQIYALLGATRIIFNTNYHRRSMHDAVAALMRRMPVKMDLSSLLARIANAQVVGVPIEDTAWIPQQRLRSHVPTQGPLIVVWNHRWEFDKAPDRFVKALDALAERGVEYRLILLGEQFGARHEAYRDVLQRHGERVMHHGMVKDRRAYFDLLRRGHVIVSSALHDFQGLSLLEGAACGLWPVVPRRLAYPELYPQACLYASHPQDPERDANALCQALVTVDRQRRAASLDVTGPRNAAQRFLALHLRQAYQVSLQALLGSGATQGDQR